MYHCSECEICVVGHDHHCGVVGLCIGDVNFKYFIQFIVYAALLIINGGVASFVANDFKVYHEWQVKVNNGQQFVLLAAAAIFGIVFLCMAFIFLHQAVCPDISSSERKWAERQL